MDVPLSAVQKLRVDHETPASLLLQWRAPADTIVTRFRVSVCAALDVCVAGGWILDPSCSPNCLCDGAVRRFGRVCVWRAGGLWALPARPTASAMATI
eukprot:536765-Rhodomonas_salina.2